MFKGITPFRRLILITTDCELVTHITTPNYFVVTQSDHVLHANC